MIKRRASGSFLEIQELKVPEFWVNSVLGRPAAKAGEMSGSRVRPRSGRYSRTRGMKVMTYEELILDCLRVGLDGKKVDYEWDKREDQSVVVKFEDGKRVRVAVHEIN